MTEREIRELLCCRHTCIEVKQRLRKMQYEYDKYNLKEKPKRGFREF